MKDNSTVWEKKTCNFLVTVIPKNNELAKPIIDKVEDMAPYVG